jgi:hypothetical protein
VEEEEAARMEVEREEADDAGGGVEEAAHRRLADVDVDGLEALDENEAPLSLRVYSYQELGHTTCGFR